METLKYMCYSFDARILGASKAPMFRNEDHYGVDPRTRFWMDDQPWLMKLPLWVRLRVYLTVVTAVISTTSVLFLEANFNLPNVWLYLIGGLSVVSSLLTFYFLFLKNTNEFFKKYTTNFDNSQFLAFYNTFLNYPSSPISVVNLMEALAREPDKKDFRDMSAFVRIIERLNVQDKDQMMLLARLLRSPRFQQETNIENVFTFDMLVALREGETVDVLFDFISSASVDDAVWLLSKFSYLRDQVTLNFFKHAQVGVIRQVALLWFPHIDLVQAQCVELMSSCDLLLVDALNVARTAVLT